MSKAMWTMDLESGVLVREYKDAVPPLKMDLSELFADFLDREEVEQRVVVNGLKQRLADATARPKAEKLTEQEKYEVQEALWTRMSVDREYKLPSEGGTRGPSASLKTIVQPLVDAGLTVEQIAGITKKSVELIERYLEG